MTGPDQLGRWSLLNPRMIIVLAHAGFGVVCLLRPNLDELLLAYRPFGDMVAWGVGLLALATVLLLAPRASLLMMLGQLVSAGALFAISLLLALGVGLLPTAATIAGLGVTSLLLFGRAVGQWLERQAWWWRWRSRPPRWLSRRRWFQRLQRRYGARHG